MVARNDVDLRVYRRVYMNAFTRTNGVDYVSREPSTRHNAEFRSTDANGSSLDELSTVSICVTVAVKSYKDARISSRVPATTATIED